MDYKILYSNVFSHKTDRTKKYISALIKIDTGFYVIGIEVTKENGRTSWSFDEKTDIEKLGLTKKDDLNIFLDILRKSKPFVNECEDYSICDFILLNQSKMKIAICDKYKCFHLIEFTSTEDNIHIDSSYEFPTKADVHKLLDKISDFNEKNSDR